MSNIGKSLPLLVILLILAGCASFTAKPSTIDFQGTSWKISSVETMEASETWLRPMESSNWASDVLLIITFDVQGEPLPSYSEQNLRNSFVNIVLRETNRKVEQFIPHSQEQGGPIDSVQCIFSIDDDTKSVGLVLPDSQIIEITFKR